MWNIHRAQRIEGEEQAADVDRKLLACAQSFSLFGRPRSEISDGPIQTFAQHYRRFPTQDLPEASGVGFSLAGIIGRQRLVFDAGASTTQAGHLHREFLNREL